MNCPISVLNLMIMVRNDIRTTGLFAVLNIIRISMLLMVMEPDKMNKHSSFLDIIRKIVF